MGLTRRPIGCRPNTPEEDARRDTADYAVFTYREEASAAAARAMPRRKHRRPYAQYVGAWDLWSVLASPNLALRTDGRMIDTQR